MHTGAFFTFVMDEDIANSQVFAIDTRPVGYAVSDKLLILIAFGV